MVRKQSRTVGTVPSKRADDFRLIKGIGPTLDGRLREAGIQTYDELASMSPSQLADKVSRLSPKQIIRQDWTGQAHKLAFRKTQSKPSVRNTPKTLQQHYVNFTIEFLLDERSRMRRTRVVHVQSGDADTWAGWESDQLIDFIARHTGVRIPAKRLAKTEEAEIRGIFAGNSNVESSAIENNGADALLRLSDSPEAVQPRVKAIRTASHAPANLDVAGVLHLQDFRALAINSNATIRSLHQHQTFRVQLTLDLTEAVFRSDIPLRYNAIIYLKPFGGASCIVAEASDAVKRSDRVALDICCASPIPGLYRPEAVVKLFSEESDLGLIASQKGDLIQVY